MNLHGQDKHARLSGFKVAHFVVTTVIRHTHSVKEVKKSVDEIVKQIINSDIELIEITGGEPLAQGTVYELIELLCDAGKTVLRRQSAYYC